ncbi:low temperature requirement protein A [Limosilactobacillus difficilis]|uniref:low temperature requirement protein A n=1 Tax=Limosilactobacillus difficilis TaxID=2991838 RepID=UPI0024BA1AF6|nr:low temperature requirement protein A [Limosilactobacillus difficilis]
MDQILTKRVSMIELFYDLVFAYTLSQATALIHHLEHGIVNPTSFLVFAVIVIVFINSWMFQSVFTNRYGKSSWKDIIFYFIDMGILLYMANAFTETSVQHLQSFFFAAGLLSLTLMIEYLIVYLRSNNHHDQAIAKVFSLILLLRTVTLFIGGLFDNHAGRWIAFLGIIISWLLPATTGKYTRQHPIIFSHLLERLTLLIIITFGETIIGIADYFRPQTFNLVSVFVFLIVVTLYFSYIVEFDHLINEKQRHETGNLLIYLHYFNLFGLSLITVSLKFIAEEHANHNFAVSCLYLGILLFYLGIILASHYNKQRVQLSKQLNLLVLAISIVIAYFICIQSSSILVITLTTTILSLLNTGMMIRLYYKLMGTK